MGLPISKTPPEQETPRKPIIVPPDHCYCGHSEGRHRGVDKEKKGGPCGFCACKEYRRRPCKCGHSYYTHGEDPCAVTGCGCEKFEEDPTPRFLLEAGYTNWKWRYLTEPQLRFLQHPDVEVRIRIWATIMLHALAGKRERLEQEKDSKYKDAWLAVDWDPRERVYRPLQPIDIEEKLQAVNEKFGKKLVGFNYRRELRNLEEQGAIIRDPGPRDHVQIFIRLEPKPTTKEDEKPTDPKPEMRTDLSAFRKLIATNESHLRDEVITPVYGLIVKRIKKLFLNHHVEGVVDDDATSVRIQEALGGQIAELMFESVRHAALTADVLGENSPSVSNNKGTAQSAADDTRKKSASPASDSVAHKQRVSVADSKEKTSSSASKRKTKDDDDDVFLSQIPQTVEAVWQWFPQADAPYFRDLWQKSLDAFERVPAERRAAAELSDNHVATAVRHCYETTHKQRSHALFLKTVPATIGTWTRNGKVGGNR